VPDDELPLLGQRALVTGAAVRLGRAIALGLARAGADVVVHCRASRGAAQATAGAVERLGRRAWVAQADLELAGEAEELWRKACAAAGPIEILVNSASIFPRDLVTDFTEEALDRNIKINAFAPLLLSRALAAHGRGGRIVNLLATRVLDYDREHAAYHLSKRMLLAITRMTALELAPEVRVNAVAPGLILPPPGEGDEFLERMAHTNPLRRHGGPEDVVAAVLYLVRAAFVTGQVLYVDGGRHMKGNVHG